MNRLFTGLATAFCLLFCVIFGVSGTASEGKELFDAKNRQQIPKLVVLKLDDVVAGPDGQIVPVGSAYPIISKDNISKQLSVSSVFRWSTTILLISNGSPTERLADISNFGITAFGNARKMMSANSNAAMPINCIPCA